MGRIKTSDIKRLARRMIAEKPEMNGDFNHNKAVVREARVAQTKRMSNKIAGYIAKTLKRAGK